MATDAFITLTEGLVTLTDGLVMVTRPFVMATDGLVMTTKALARQSCILGMATIWEIRCRSTTFDDETERMVGVPLRIVAFEADVPVALIRAEARR